MNRTAELAARLAALEATSAASDAAAAAALEELIQAGTELAAAMARTIDALEAA
ncbi:MAG: hypothetical protein KME02_12800 [Aphanothece saxicola GSE-SYN-MK-01-06B]|jgi:hypothetical protein|nr:hypothetical protein [Aphanothece saxicola GSE-SYN-MK-01-06B]